MISRSTEILIPSTDHANAPHALRKSVNDTTCTTQSDYSDHVCRLHSKEACGESPLLDQNSTLMFLWFTWQCFTLFHRKSPGRNFFSQGCASSYTFDNINLRFERIKFGIMFLTPDGSRWWTAKIFHIHIFTYCTNVIPRKLLSFSCVVSKPSYHSYSEISKEFRGIIKKCRSIMHSG